MIPNLENKAAQTTAVSCIKKQRFEAKCFVEIHSTLTFDLWEKIYCKASAELFLAH
jgi:hypothetical protein